MPYARNQLLTRVVPPASEPVTLTEAKLYLRVNNNNEDTLITDLIVTARMVAEDFLRKSLIIQSWKLVCDGDDVGLSALSSEPVALSAADDDVKYNVFKLPMGPVNSIGSVVAVGRDGSMQTIPNTAYYLNAAHNALVMDSMPSAFRLEITYNTGYGDANTVPRPVKQGMLAHIAAMFDNRGADDEAGLPEQTERLYSGLREVRL